MNPASPRALALPITLAVILAGLTGATIAKAHPGFPQKVAEVVGSAAPPPQSCNLCHVSSGGGGPLRAFGSLLVSTYGLSSSRGAEDDASLEAALQGLQVGEPALYADLQSGADPNVDAALTANPRVTPEFGCASSAAGGAGSLGGGLGVALAALGVVTRRAARR